MGVEKKQSKTKKNTQVVPESELLVQYYVTRIRILTGPIIVACQ